MNRRDLLLGASSLTTAAVVANSQIVTAKSTASNATTRIGKTVRIAPDLPGYYVTPAGTGKFPGARGSATG
jgi:carboxymethylenebutenolidase